MLKIHLKNVSMITVIYDEIKKVFLLDMSKHERVQYEI